MNKKGLTLSIIFEAESANYGEGLGNVTSLKKISRGNGESFSYISRQALRYNIIQQMGVDNTPLGLDGTVIQFQTEATIKDYPEIDLFGYMKTEKPVRTRAAVVRLSNAIALESFNADLDFLTNRGLLDRYNEQRIKVGDKYKEGGNIAQNEIHKSYYAYTITIDLDQVGIDKNDNIEIENDEKERRVILLLNTLKFLYRDIKGRRENLSPIFAIGGVYNIKNPFFENRLIIKNNRLSTKTLNDVICLADEIKSLTHIGYIKGIFNNDEEIEENFEVETLTEVFKSLEEDVRKYYKEGK